MGIAKEWEEVEEEEWERKKEWSCRKGKGRSRIGTENELSCRRGIGRGCRIGMGKDKERSRRGIDKKK